MYRPRFRGLGGGTGGAPGSSLHLRDIVSGDVDLKASLPG